MNQTVTISFELADLIPLFTGSMIFASVLLAGVDPAHPKAGRYRRLAWILGGTSQLLLFSFGGLTGHWSFGSHLLVAGAFTVNLIRSYRSPNLLKQTNRIDITTAEQFVSAFKSKYPKLAGETIKAEDLNDIDPAYNRIVQDENGKSHYDQT